MSLLAVLMTGCGTSDDGDDATGRPSNLGGSCEGGSDCGTGEFCFIDVGADAICEAVPSACVDDPCGECAEIDALCEGSTCIAFGSSVDVECF
jgi:hypothetical protein